MHNFLSVFSFSVVLLLLNGETISTMKTKYSITRYRSKVMIFIAQDEPINDL